MSAGRLDAVVVGAGANGLVAANLLADRGWRVEVLEANDEPGGAMRSGEVCEPGFTHDRFSSFYPFAFMGPIQREFALEDHGLRWRRAPLVLAHVRPDEERAAILSPDLGETCAGLEADHPGDAHAWRLLADRWDRFEPGFRRAFFTPFPPVAGALQVAAGFDPRDLTRLVRFMLLNVRRLGQEHFGGRDARDLLAGTALHADLAPENVGGGAFGFIMCMLGQRYGFPVPEGGSSALAQALTRRLEQRGGRVRLGTPVARIDVRDGRAHGVITTHGEHVRARHVLADVDAQVLYLRLVGAEHLSSRVLADLRRFERDSATVKVDWSLDGPAPWRDERVRRTGCFHLTGGVDELSVSMAQMATAQVPEKPFLVGGQYAVTDPTRQPAGKDTMWAYSHVPQDGVGDAAGELSGRWREGELERFADRMQARIEQAAPGFGELVRRRVVTGPRDLEDSDQALVGGAINGGTAHLHQLALFRPIPAQLGRPEAAGIRGLYLAGASAHPSGGVHGAPGTIAARAALRHDLPRRVVRALGQRSNG